MKIIRSEITVDLGQTAEALINAVHENIRQFIESNSEEFDVPAAVIVAITESYIKQALSRGDILMAVVGYFEGQKE